MPENAHRVAVLLRQQAAIAKFGSFALRQSDLVTVLTEAARVCAEGLNVPFCNVCRYRSAENDLLIEAGFGWQPLAWWASSPRAPTQARHKAVPSSAGSH
jgi:hypothetical protein